MLCLDDYWVDFETSGCISNRKHMIEEVSNTHRRWFRSLSEPKHHMFFFNNKPCLRLPETPPFKVFFRGIYVFFEKKHCRSLSIDGVGAGEALGARGACRRVSLDPRGAQRSGDKIALGIINITKTL